MRELERRTETSAIGIEGNPKSKRCNPLSAHARLIWPSKTAANWAFEAGVQERMAKYWLSGSHPVSEKGRLAIIRLLSCL